MDRVIQDVAFIVKDPFFSKEITITPPSAPAFTVRGLPVRITQTVTEHDGADVTGPFSHVTFVEQDLIDNGVTARKSSKLATMKGWGIEWTDAVQTWTYKVSETLPDSTVGTISLILKDV